MGDQSTQVSDMVRRYPDFGDNISDQQDQPAFDVEPVSLDLGTGDLSNLQGVGDHGLGRDGRDQIVDLPGIGS